MTVLYGLIVHVLRTVLDKLSMITKHIICFSGHMGQAMRIMIEATEDVGTKLWQLSDV